MGTKEEPLIHDYKELKIKYIQQPVTLKQSAPLFPDILQICEKSRRMNINFMMAKTLNSRRHDLKKEKKRLFSLDVTK